MTLLYVERWCSAASPVILARLYTTSGGLMVFGFVRTVGVFVFSQPFRPTNSRQRRAMLKVVRQHESEPVEPPANGPQSDMT